MEIQSLVGLPRKPQYLLINSSFRIRFARRALIPKEGHHEICALQGQKW